MSAILDRAGCELSSISDFILAYTFEGLIIAWGVFILVFITGLIWIGKKIYDDLFFH